jgi:hypothetical protein
MQLIYAALILLNNTSQRNLRVWSLETLDVGYLKTLKNFKISKIGPHMVSKLQTLTECFVNRVELEL